MHLQHSKKRSILTILNAMSTIEVTSLFVKQNELAIFKEATKDFLAIEKIVAVSKTARVVVSYDDATALFQAGKQFESHLRNFEKLENSFDFPF